MALVLDNATFTAGAASANVRVLVHTAAANSVLLIFAGDAEGTSLSAVAAGGIACTRLGQVQYNVGTRNVEIWGLTAPATGALTISAIHSGNNPSLWVLGAMTYTGHKTDVGGPFGDVVLRSATGTSIVTTISAQVGDIIAIIDSNNLANNLDFAAGITTRFSSTAGGLHKVVIGDFAVTAASHNLTAVATSAGWWGSVAVNIRASATGNVTGVFSATDAPDVFSAPGYVLVQGSFAATDTADKFTATAAVRISAGFAATDAPDLFSASGVVTNPRVIGVFAATDAPDLFTATAAVRVTGIFTATDTPDTFSASGQTIVRATFNATDAADTLSAPAYVVVSAGFAATDAPDLFSATATVYNPRINATFSATDAPDTFAAQAAVRITATFTATDTPDTFSASGTVVSNAVTAVFNATDTPDAFTATAAIRISAFLSATDAQDVFLATVNNISASAAVTTAPVDSAGHGRKSNNKPPYIPAPRDFWDARENYLKSIHAEIESEPPPAPRQPAAFKQPAPKVDPTILPAYRFERQQIVTALPKAPSMRKLRAEADKLRAINAKIAEQKRLELEAERAKRQAIRKRAIQRQKKLLGALMAARALLKLYFHHLP